MAEAEDEQMLGGRQSDQIWPWRKTKTNRCWEEDEAMNTFSLSGEVVGEKTRK